MEDKIKKLHDLLGEMELKLKKISEELNRKPREFWINEYVEGYLFLYTNKESAFSTSSGVRGAKTIHVREVIDE